MPTTLPPTLAELLVRILAPSVGDNMARAIARGQCEKLGIVGPRATGEQIEQLSAALRPGLNVFVGKDTAERILRDVQAALRATSHHD